MSKSTDASALPLLRSCPRRALKWKEDPEGRAVLLRPRFGRGWLGKRLQQLLGSADYRIRLDNVGTAVWKRCDGQTPVETIAADVRTEFGDRIEPANERVVAFIQQMMRGRMVEF